MTGKVLRMTPLFCHPEGVCSREVFALSNLKSAPSSSRLHLLFLSPRSRRLRGFLIEEVKELSLRLHKSLFVTPKPKAEGSLIEGG